MDMNGEQTAHSGLHLDDRQTVRGERQTKRAGVDRRRLAATAAARPILAVCCCSRLGNAGLPISRHSVSADPCWSSRTVISAMRPFEICSSTVFGVPPAARIGIIPDGDDQAAIGTFRHQGILQLG